MSVTWEQALADCEARLDAADAALAAGHPVEVEAFAAPAVATPLPAELVARARALTTRGEELGERLAGEIARIRDEVRRIPRVPRAESASRFEAQA